MAISQSGCVWKYSSKQKHVQSRQQINNTRKGTASVNIIWVSNVILKLLAYKTFLKSMMGTAFNKTSNFCYKWRWQSLFLPSDCDEICFSKDSGLYYKWQWWSLWRSLLLSPYCGILFLVKIQAFTINSREEVSDGPIFISVL